MMECPFRLCAPTVYSSFKLLSAGHLVSVTQKVAKVGPLLALSTQPQVLTRAMGEAKEITHGKGRRDISYLCRGHDLILKGSE